MGTFELLDRAAADGSRSRRRSLPGPPLTIPDLESLLGSEGEKLSPSLPSCFLTGNQ